MKPEANSGEVSDWQLVAAQIINHRHLKAFLLAMKASDRHEVYNILAPHLNFKPRPYWMLMA